MQKTVLITGSTDGIGFATAQALALQNHNVLLHGRNTEKLESTNNTISQLNGNGSIESFLCDLSDLSDVEAMAQAIKDKHSAIDVLINNAGVLKTSSHKTQDGLDTRFVVNTLAPYLLTNRLLPLMNKTGRVVNLSSAAQETVNLDALAGKTNLDDMPAYAQSKLAITMWTFTMADTHKDQGPMFYAINPGSLLATKMVKEGFNIAGNDINIGSDILVRSALSDEFATASGQYFDNDSSSFAQPHSDATDPKKSRRVVDAIESILSDAGYPV